MEKIEQKEGKENIERESRIVLHFLRHGKKGKGEDDYKVELTPEGRMEAKTKAGNTNLKQAMAMGSPRARALQSAALVMSGTEDTITGSETSDELKVKLNSGRDFGTKVFVDSRLDFTVDPEAPLGVKVEEEYGVKKLFRFVVNESDNFAKGVNERTSTYSSMASDVAEIVQKYLGVSKRWHELVNDKGKNYEESMERFLGSHQTVTESFLAKVIEKTKGIEERDKLVEALNNGQGFDFLEGFDVEIVQRELTDIPVIRVRYSKVGKDSQDIFSFNEVVSSEVLEEIIKEGNK